MFSALRIAIVFVISVPVTASAAQTSHLAEIRAALDSWSGLRSTRETILEITTDPVPALIDIAGAQEELFFRRWHAIHLLWTFPGERSEKALEQLTEDPNPTFRCSAMTSLVTLNAQSSVPVLIRMLDDRGVCLTSVSTDPHEERDVYVSDVAVRLLENATGRSFEKAPLFGHRKTKPWKKWWAKQKKTQPKSEN